MFASPSGQPAAGNEDISAQAQHGKMGARKPAPILVYQNVPLENRAQPDITPSDPKWKEMLSYFNTLMSTPGVTLDDILKDHFTPHELRKFMPTIDEPFAKWQQEDTELFKRTLETRFKGVLPTLPMKMTMLYFGLPVAPMKFGRNQYVTSGDLDDPMEDVVMERDPLSFLDDYEERRYGVPPSEVKYIRLGSNPQWEESESLSLRGGFLEEDDMESVESQSQYDEDMASQPQDSSAVELSLRGGSRVAKSFRMFSRQGQADIAEGCEGLAQGINQLLSLVPYPRTARLVFTILTPANGRTEVEATVHSPVTPEAAYNNVGLGNVLSYMDGQKSGQVFVRELGDVAPATFEPRPLDGGIATITIQDTDGLERVGYLRTASRPNLSHSVTNYAPGYQQTLKALIGSHHQYITYPNVSGPDGPVTVYSCEDIPQQLISDMATHPYCNIKAIVSNIDENIVPIIVPDSQHLHSSKNYIELFRQDIGDLSALNKVVEFALSRQSDRGRNPTALHVHFPGENFQDSNEIPDVLVDLVGGRPTQAALQEWCEKVGGSKFATEGGFSIVVQPWYDTYLVSVPQSMQKTAHYRPTEIRLHECNLNLFKLRVETSLYPNHYDPQNSEHTIIVEDDARSSRHVITSESTEQDWQRILRRLMSQDIEVTLRKGDRELRWNADENSYWGPCYNRAHLNYVSPRNRNDPASSGISTASVKSGNIGFNPSNASSVGTTKTFGSSKSQEMADALYQTYSSRLNDFMEMKGSDHSMRDLTVWDTPSIFTNPMKPVMPLHAPPLESVIRTGPDVPAITLGMRTATEMARLEREVHTLRAQLLDRIRECPYNDCDRKFNYMDTHGFERHIKYEHKILQCALCTAFKSSGDGDIDIDQSLMYMNRDQILFHIAEEHAQHLQKFIQVPKGGQGSRVWDKATPEHKRKIRMVLFPYCGNCGRPEVKLNDPEDILHHHLACRGNNTEGGRANLKPAPFCKVCGSQSVLTPDGRKCANKSCGSHDPHATCDDPVCCHKCGFNLTGCSRMYQAQHDHFCRPLPGRVSQHQQRYCPFCGVFLDDIDVEEKEEHIWYCRDRPQPKPQKCPICDTPGSRSTSLLFTPQEVRSHLETFHEGSSHCPWCEAHMLSSKTGLEWADDLKHYHFAQHMGQVSPFVQIEAGVEGANVAGSQCPYFHDCGVHATDMSSDQWHRHMESCHPGLPFYPNGMPNPSLTAPPSGYGSGSAKGREFFRNKHGKAPAAAAAGGPSNGNKKRPCPYGPPGMELFQKGAWASSTITDEDAGSEPSLQDPDGSDGKRRKASFEEDLTYTEPQGAEAEPEEEYMDTRHDSDQGQDLDTEMPPPPQQPPKSPRIVKKTPVQPAAGKAHRSLQPPQRFSPEAQARDKAPTTTTTSKTIATKTGMYPFPEQHKTVKTTRPGSSGTATSKTAATKTTATSGAGGVTASEELRPRGVGKNGNMEFPWGTDIYGPKSPTTRKYVAKPSSSPAAASVTTTGSQRPSPPPAAMEADATQQGFSPADFANAARADFARFIKARKQSKAAVTRSATAPPEQPQWSYEGELSAAASEEGGEQGEQGEREQQWRYEGSITPPLCPTSADKVEDPLRIGPRGPGEPFIVKVTKRDPQKQLETTATAVVTSIEEDVQPTTRSGRRPRPTAAKLASAAAAATRTSARRQTPAKFPVKTTAASTRASRSAQIEEAEEEVPKSAASTTAPRTRAPSPAKRGRPRK